MEAVGKGGSGRALDDGKQGRKEGKGMEGRRETVLDEDGRKGN